jgi:hypothetical protein
MISKAGKIRAEHPGTAVELSTFDVQRERGAARKGILVSAGRVAWMCGACRLHVAPAAKLVPIR